MTIESILSRQSNRGIIISNTYFLDSGGLWKMGCEYYCHHSS